MQYRTGDREREMRVGEERRGEFSSFTGFRSLIIILFYFFAVFAEGRCVLYCQTYCQTVEYL